MNGQHRTQTVIRTRADWLWTHFTVMALGLWMVTSPFTFGYHPGRMLDSDLISGAGLFFFAAMALIPRMDFTGRWGAGLVGIWLQFAPLVFWAPQPVMMLNDTLIGVLAVALSLLIPAIPGAAHHTEMMKPGPEIPPGWSYNPSSWRQRAPMIGLALIGWFLSRYLAAYQLGYIPAVWDPFFGDGTRLVLTSNISKIIPVPDAGLGALAYTLEMLMGCMGGTTRWRVMPCMVLFFFILVVPLGLVSITLVILQPVVVGHWCFLCLMIASIMLLMIPFAVDEVFATIQFLRRSHRRGKPFWRTFLVGGTPEGEKNKDKRTLAYGAPAVHHLTPMAWGVSVPWTLLASALLGIWLMVSPAVWGMTGSAADSSHIAGALIAATSVIAMAEVIRKGRYFNLLLGSSVICGPWLLTGADPSAAWNGVLIGVLVIGLSLPRGKILERYGSWRP